MESDGREEHKAGGTRAVHRSAFNDEKVKSYPVTRHVTLVVHHSPFIIHIQRSFNLNGTVHSFIVQLCKILTLFLLGDYFTTKHSYFSRCLGIRCLMTKRVPVMKMMLMLKG